MSQLINLIILGVIAYLVDRFIPMAEPIKTVFRIVVAVIAIVILYGFLKAAL